ncbi:hypothetical protein, partial [uncultured Desulfovibrio sp.]|uniref:hypothetical protein n=1 Tax=uncultured Desulfovibrio sp. TaxID=167968 RepID=UPI002611F060
MPVAVHRRGYGLRCHTGYLRYIHKILSLLVEKALNFTLGIGAPSSVGLQLAHGILHPELEALALLKWGRPAMADLSRYFSTARKFFLRYFLRIVNENCAKLYFLAKKIFSGKTNGLAIFCAQKFAQNLTARNFCAMNDLAERLI